MNTEWEPVIGLEIHAALNTKSKLFSPAPNHFGDEPNTNITEVCVGLPGSLPVLNKEAVRKAVQFGCAINGTIALVSKFDRKSYFYPDNPRNFQITQYENPIVIGGEVIVELNGDEKTFPITRVHLEDDAGMLKHFSGFAGVDFNRAGCPLIEIVSEPCIHTPHEASAYAMAIKAILQYIDASDCNMEEGSLRFDANVSVRPKGEKTLRNRTEIKNMNSFSNMELAIESEIRRQIREYTSNPDKHPDEVVVQSTYRWDPEKKEPVLMRSKEFAEDYRYFPEPDLVPIVLTEAYIEEIRKALPELPLQREKRYIHELGLSSHSAFILTSDKPLSDYFEEALASCEYPRSLCNWLTIEFAGRLKDSGQTIMDLGIPAKNVAILINMIEQGAITGKIAKSVADDMMVNPEKDPQSIVSENPDYQPLHDEAEIECYVDRAIAENPQSVSDYLSGHEKALSFLVGQVMMMCRGKASPPLVNELLKEKIKAKS